MDAENKIEHKQMRASVSRRPLLFIAAAFAGGILLFRYLSPFFWVVVQLLSLVSILLYLRICKHGAHGRIAGALKYDRILLLFGVAAFAVGGLYSEWHERLMVGLSSPLKPYMNIQVRVIRPPEEFVRGVQFSYWKSCIAEVMEINGNEVEPVPVRLAGKSGATFRAGDILRGRAVWRKPRVPLYPGAFDYAAYLKTKGLVADLRFVRGRHVGEDVYAVERKDCCWLRRMIWQLRARAIDSLLYAVHGREGQFLAAVIYGYRIDVDEGMRNSFRTTGIGHILAISGLHVGLVVGVFWILFSWIFVDRRKVAALCIAVCLLYLAFSGGRVAAVRATIMATIYLGGFVLVRKSDFVNSLGAAALLILMFNPYSLFDVGFQLSFIAVLFISRMVSELELAVLFVQKYDVEQMDGIQNVKGSSLLRVRRYLLGLVLMSISAWIGVWPITAYVFNQVNPVGLVVNLVALPLMGVVLIGGILMQIVSFFPFLSGLGLSVIFAFPAKLMIFIARTVGENRWGSFDVQTPKVWVVFVYYICFVVFFLRRMVGCHSWRKGLKIASLGGATVASCLLVASFFRSDSTESFTFRFVPSYNGETIYCTDGDGTSFVLAESSGQLSRIEECANDLGWKKPDTILLFKDIHGKKLLADKIEIEAYRDKCGGLVAIELMVGGHKAVFFPECWPERAAYWLKRLQLEDSGALIFLHTRNKRDFDYAGRIAEMVRGCIVFESGFDCSHEAGVHMRRDFGLVELTIAYKKEPVCRAFDGRCWVIAGASF